LPAFPTTHDAKIAKLALPGLKQGNFYALFAGKNNGLPSRCRAETAPINDIIETQKAYRTLLNNFINPANSFLLFAVF